jgi:hypothetical protein
MAIGAIRSISEQYLALELPTGANDRLVMLSR